MGALFSDRNDVRHGPLGPTPPPPQAAASFFFEDEPEATPRKPGARPPGLRFDAELDLSELDDRDRPGLVWSARGRELSRAHMALRSRRMCYQGRRLLIAVHLIDDKPVLLVGKVTGCDYDGDGLYRVDLDLIQVPSRPEIMQWIEDRGR
jgi:hypothetical protein